MSFNTASLPRRPKKGLRWASIDRARRGRTPLSDESDLQGGIGIKAQSHRPDEEVRAVVTNATLRLGSAQNSLTVKMGEKMLEFAYSLDNVDSQRRGNAAGRITGV
jgi:hypothetical protein